MTDARLRTEQVRTGAAYEAERSSSRARLAETSALRRLELGHDLVLVFESEASVRAALEETLRTRRVTDPEQVAAEAAAFAELLPQPGQLVATLYLELADPAALADRTAELDDVASALTLEVGERMVFAQVDEPGLDGGATRVVFDLGAAGARIEAAGQVALVLEHPRVRARVAVTAEQLRDLAAE